MSAPYDAGNGMVIPARMMEGLDRYIQHGVLPGGFLTAVLSNDFSGACGRADSDNVRILPAYAVYLYNEAPSPCWGSQAKVRAWVKSFETSGEAA